MRRHRHRRPARERRARLLAKAKATAKATATALATTVALAALAAPTQAAHTRKLPKQSPEAALDQQHALDAYSALQRTYYIPTKKLYRGSPYASAWGFSQAMAATISVAALPGEHRVYQQDLIARLSSLQAYANHTDPAPAGYDAQATRSRGGRGGRYNDDNEWIAIELLRLYRIDRQPNFLSAANQLYKLVVSHWDTRTGVPCPGGVPWTSLTVNGDRNTVTDGPGAELGAQLYATTHDVSDLRWAMAMYGWVRSCLLQPDGLYGDHINGQGQIDPTEWTYNQGAMIGAGVMLYEATRIKTFLQQAEATADAALKAFGPQQLADQPVYFNAIYIRNLLLLSAASGITRYQSFAQSFADDAWYNVRDPNSGLFLADPGGATQLLDQASMTQVYALLALPPSAYF